MKKIIHRILVVALHFSNGGVRCAGAGSKNDKFVGYLDAPTRI
jgi:hypothetical protein